MAVYYKNGSWQRVPKGYAKVGGNWEIVKCLYVKIDGSWEAVCCGNVGGPDPQTVSPEIFWSLTQTADANDVLDDGARSLNLQASSDDVADEVTLTWDVFNESLVDVYEVHRADTKNGSFTKIAEPASTQYVDSTISEGEKKFYKVRSVLSVGGPSQFTPVRSASLISVEVGTSSVTYSSISRKTVDVDVTSFSQLDAAQPILRWKESGQSTFQNNKETDAIVSSNSVTPFIDIATTYPSSPTVGLFSDDPQINGSGNNPSVHVEIDWNGDFIASRTSGVNEVRIWDDTSFDLLDSIGEDYVSIAFRGDGHLGALNDSSSNDGLQVYSVDSQNGTLTQVFSEGTEGGEIAFHEATGRMAVASGTNIRFYDSSFNLIEDVDYRSFPDPSNIISMKFRESDGSLLAVQNSTFDNADESLLIIDSARNVVDRLGTEISVADWNNFSGPNADYLVAMTDDTESSAAETFDVWDPSLNKVGSFDTGGWTSSGPSADLAGGVDWKPDGGVVFSIDGPPGEISNSLYLYDENFNVYQSVLVDGSDPFDIPFDTADANDALVTEDNEIYVSYSNFGTELGGFPGLPMITKHEVPDEELGYNRSYDANFELRTQGISFSPNDVSFDTNIPTAPSQQPSNITFESFNVTANVVDEKIDITWTVSDFRTPDSYNVYRADTAGGTFTQIANVSGTGYTDDPGIGEFFYYVRIVVAGTEYAQSATKSAELNPTNSSYILSRDDFIGDPALKQSRLGNAWDLSKAARVSNINVDRKLTAGEAGGQDDVLVSVQGFFFRPDGTRIFFLRDTENNSPALFQASLSEAYETSTLQNDEDFLEITSLSSFPNNPNGIFFRPDGSQVFLSQQETMEVYKINLSSAWDITTASFSQTVTLDDPNQTGEVINGDIVLKPDGTELYATLDSGHVASFTLGTPWDITTASFQNKVSVPDASGGLFFREDGTRFYTATTKGAVVENLMTTAWDVTTKTEMNSGGFATNEAVGVQFNTPVDTYETPSNVQTNYDSNNVEVTISWDTNSTNISHYNVYRADSSGGNFTEVSGSDVTNTYFIDSSVSAGTSYFYKVSAVRNDTTETELSDEVEVSTVGFLLNEGFEIDLSNWSVPSGGGDPDFEIKNDNVFAGSQSAGIQGFSDTYNYATYNLNSAQQISEAEFYYFETNEQTGSGIRFFNSNGNQEIGVATNNPEWVFAPTENEADIIEVFDGTDDPNGGGTEVYSIWHRVNLQFDWGNTEVNWTWENTADGITKTGTQPIQQGVDIADIRLHQFKGFGGEAWATSGSPDTAMWYDNITLR